MNKQAVWEECVSILPVCLLKYKIIFLKYKITQTFVIFKI